MDLQLLKNKLGNMLKDEKGATVSAESLIVIVGSSLVAAIVIGVITFVVVGDSTGGGEGNPSNESIVGKVTNKVMEATQAIINHDGGEYWEP